MSLRISFHLDDDDLQHFQLIMRAARKAIAHKSPEEIVASAVALLQQLDNPHRPGFILKRLKKLKMMTEMIQDPDWRLPHDEVVRILQALAYFAEPDDLIPDHIPGLGYLDDAIVAELLVRELRHEIDAYRDFCKFRERERMQSAGVTDLKLRGRLRTKRAALQLRMRKRRQQELQRQTADRDQVLDKEDQGT